jgi:two-component system response regulator FixJ
MAKASEIYVIDDDEAIRRALSLLLRSTGFTPYAYPSAQQFLEECERLRPGCVITDVRMPGMRGLELVRRMKEMGLPHPVIIMTGHADVPVAVQAMKAGAIDFLEKPLDDARLLKAILAAQNAGGSEDSQAARRGQAAAMLQGLSPRELDVLSCVVAGKANKVIALELGISPRTVEVHRANLMRKLGAGSLSELVRISLAGGLDPSAR